MYLKKSADPFSTVLHVYIVYILYTHMQIYMQISLLCSFLMSQYKKLAKRHFLKCSYILIFTNLLWTDNETETEKTIYS